MALSTTELAKYVDARQCFRAIWKAVEYGIPDRSRPAGLEMPLAGGVDFRKKDVKRSELMIIQRYCRHWSHACANNLPKRTFVHASHDVAEVGPQITAEPIKLMAHMAVLRSPDGKSRYSPSAKLSKCLRISIRLISIDYDSKQNETRNRHTVRYRAQRMIGQRNRPQLQ